MDYLRTLGSAAVSSIVQKSGLNLPFSLGKKLPPLDTQTIWTLYDATKRVKIFCWPFFFRCAQYGLGRWNPRVSLRVQQPEMAQFTPGRSECASETARNATS